MKLLEINENIINYLIDEEEDLRFMLYAISLALFLVVFIVIFIVFKLPPSEIIRAMVVSLISPIYEFYEYRKRIQSEKN